MTKNATDITIVLDASGSMSTDQENTRNAVNEFIHSQKQVDGECRISLFTFDSGYGIDGAHLRLKKVWDNINIREIKELARESYTPNGGTPLYDAVHSVVDSTGERLRRLPEHERPNQVLMVIMTDGGENTSRNKNVEQLKEKIQHQENKYSWNFIFLGADFNSQEVTSSFGLSAARSVNFTKGDMVSNYKGLSGAVKEYRTSGLSKVADNFSEVAANYTAQENNSVSQGK